jgi:hypothetical protein
LPTSAGRAMFASAGSRQGRRGRVYIEVGLKLSHASAGRAASASGSGVELLPVSALGSCGGRGGCVCIEVRAELSPASAYRATSTSGSRTGQGRSCPLLAMVKRGEEGGAHVADDRYGAGTGPSPKTAHGAGVVTSAAGHGEAGEQRGGHAGGGFAAATRPIAGSTPCHEAAGAKLTGRPRGRRR